MAGSNKSSPLPRPPNKFQDQHDAQVSTPAPRTNAQVSTLKTPVHLPKSRTAEQVATPNLRRVAEMYDRPTSSTHRADISPSQRAAKASASHRNLEPASSRKTPPSIHTGRPGRKTSSSDTPRIRVSLQNINTPPVTPQRNPSFHSETTTPSRQYMRIPIEPNQAARTPQITETPIRQKGRITSASYPHAKKTKASKAKDTVLAEKPGDDRNETPQNVPTKPNESWEIESIVASRMKDSNPRIKEYKVKWHTSWEEASSLRKPHGGVAVEAFNATPDRFDYIARDGRVWNVLPDSHSWQNDSDELQWEMWKAIRRNVIKDVKKDWFDDMDDGDFDWSITAQRDARRNAGKHGIDTPETPLDALKTAHAELRANPDLSDDDLLYGNVHVQFTGRFDTQSDPKGSVEKRGTFTIGKAVRAITAGVFDDLAEDEFARAGAYDRLQVWKKTVRELIFVAPFMFRDGTWVQLFALLILEGDDFIAQLNLAHIRTKADWNNYAREYGLQMYYDMIVDNRAPHDIQETFLNLHSYFTGLTPDKHRASERDESSEDEDISQNGDVVEHQRGKGGRGEGNSPLFESKDTSNERNNSRSQQDVRRGETPSANGYSDEDSEEERPGAHAQDPLEISDNNSDDSDDSDDYPDVIPCRQNSYHSDEEDTHHIDPKKVQWLNDKNRPARRGNNRQGRSDESDSSQLNQDLRSKSYLPPEHDQTKRRKRHSADEEEVSGPKAASHTSKRARMEQGTPRTHISKGT
ncbi:hypothetical protein K504DRAFT_493935 [Pleomassaria siparia CBS 279.74]|uniref:Uncharacterized protein n=1 Tax=Pleomassaria siparia CBS 279.74 TaxID=1314801 RepID=A0A6G1JXZ7_9PLEO|nr:hypothetical protein K504DRAFT_493935 [Pleomassaria siparia CBS 279.74]